MFLLYCFAKGLGDRTKSHDCQTRWSTQWFNLKNIFCVWHSSKNRSRFIPNLKNCLYTNFHIKNGNDHLAKNSAASSSHQSSQVNKTQLVLSSATYFLLPWLRRESLCRTLTMFGTSISEGWNTLAVFISSFRLSDHVGAYFGNAKRRLEVEFQRMDLREAIVSFEHLVEIVMRKKKKKKRGPGITTESDSDSDGSFSPIGAVIGVLVVAGFISCCVLFCCIRRRNARKRQQNLTDVPHSNNVHAQSHNNDPQAVREMIWVHQNAVKQLVKPWFAERAWVSWFFLTRVFRYKSLPNFVCWNNVVIGFQME